MSTRNLILLLIPLVLLAGFLLNMRSEPLSESADVSGSVVYDQDVAQLVENFGLALKHVPLLAPGNELQSAIEAEYAAFVSDELLDEWLRFPGRAPGRATSSPWPARIQFGYMEPSMGGFIVHGTVVDVVNGMNASEEIVGTYPVRLEVQKDGGTWRITRYQEGHYSRIPSRKEVVGAITCLPHRDTTGPQTLECAFGVQEDSTGDYYAIDTLLMANTDWISIPSGATVRIEGVMVPVEQLSTHVWQKYDIVGIVAATTIQRI